MDDSRGLSVSSGDAACLAAYESALRQFNTYRGDPIAAIDAVLEEQPDFVMGHALRGHVMISMWERSVVGDVTAVVDRLDELRSDSNERERTHAVALRQWVRGEWNAMRATLDRLLVDHPRDLLALQAGHLADFYHGDRDNLRGRVARSLPAWDNDVDGYGFLLGMYAFGLEECSSYGAAEDMGRAALDLVPDDCWAHHAVTHVMEMQTRQAEGITFMIERLPHWAQDDNAFAFHNAWHLALFHLDQLQPAAALDLFDRSIRPEPSGAQLMLADAVALLWRMHLRDLDVGSRWDEIASAYEHGNEAGFYAFNDMHAMMAYTASTRTGAAASLLRAAEEASMGLTTNAKMLREVGLPIVRAVDAYGRQQYGAVVDLLMPVRYRAHLFGGSHAQRDIVHRTLLESAIRSGDRALALSLAEERSSLRPNCLFTDEQRHRALAIG